MERVNPNSLAPYLKNPIQLSSCSKRYGYSIQETTNHIAEFILLSFGLKFSKVIATKFALTKELQSTYVKKYQQLQIIYGGLKNGESPMQIQASKQLFFDAGILCSLSPAELMTCELHFLIGILPAPYLEKPMISNAADVEYYTQLEDQHKQLRHELFSSLSQEPMPQPSVELQLFTTRCEGIKEIRWAFLIKQWGELTDQKDKANQFLCKHPLYHCCQDFKLSSSIKLARPLNLQKRVSFQTFVCERTLNLIEGIIGFYLPSSVRDSLFQLFKSNESLRMRIAYLIWPTNHLMEDDLSHDQPEQALFKTIRILVNLLKQVPKESLQLQETKELVVWVFNRNPIMKDANQLDRPNYSEKRPEIAPEKFVPSIQNLSVFYSSQETFQKDALSLVTHISTHSYNIQIFQFLKTYSTFPFIRIKTDQFISLSKKNFTTDIYTLLIQCCQMLADKTRSTPPTPSYEAFDFILEHYSNPYIREHLDAVIGIFDQGETVIPGKNFFLAMQTALTTTHKDMSFAKTALSHTKKYHFSPKQKLHLFVVCLKSDSLPKNKSESSERQAFLDTLDFMNLLELLLGDTLEVDLAYQMLLFHPCMITRKNTYFEFQRLLGIRNQLLLSEEAFLPQEMILQITEIIGNFLQNAPQGFLPKTSEYKDRSYFEREKAYSTLVTTVMTIVGKLNFSLLGLPIGQGDSDVAPVLFFQSFFPRKIEGNILEHSPDHQAYLTLESVSLSDIAYYGQWVIRHDLLTFFGCIIYHKTGKTSSIEVPLNLSIDTLNQEKSFFEVLSTLYLDVCNEFYLDESYPNQYSSFTNLSDCLVYYKSAAKTWEEYQPNTVEREDLSPIVFAFLKKLRLQTRRAIHFLSSQHMEPPQQNSYLEIAARCCLHPNSCLNSLSLLPPWIPSFYHSGFCIDKETDQPQELFEKTKTPTQNFTDVGKLLTTNEKELVKLPLKMKITSGEDQILIGLRTCDVEMTVSYPKAKFSHHHMVWQLLMLKGRYYRSLVLKEM